MAAQLTLLQLSFPLFLLFLRCDFACALMETGYDGASFYDTKNGLCCELIFGKFTTKKLPIPGFQIFFEAARRVTFDQLAFDILSSQPQYYIYVNMDCIILF